MLYSVCRKFFSCGTVQSSTGKLSSICVILESCSVGSVFATDASASVSQPRSISIGLSASNSASSSLMMLPSRSTVRPPIL